MVPSARITQAYNRYVCTYNNPVKYNDPSGHCLEDLCIAEIAFVAVVVEEADPELGEQVEEGISDIAPEVGDFVAEEAPIVTEAIANTVEDVPSLIEGEELPIQSTANEYTDLLYRAGSKSMSNMTPRMSNVVDLPEGEEPGLSTYNSIDNLMKGNPDLKPGAPVQVIDPSKLEGTALKTVFDDPLTGHVSITVKSGVIQDLIDWASTRPNVIGQANLALAHPFTLAIYNAVVKTIAIPK